MAIIIKKLCTTFEYTACLSIETTNFVSFSFKFKPSSAQIKVQGVQYILYCTKPSVALALRYLMLQS